MERAERFSFFVRTMINDEDLIKSFEYRQVLELLKLLFDKKASNLFIHSS